MVDPKMAYVRKKIWPTCLVEKDPGRGMEDSEAKKFARIKFGRKRKGERRTRHKMRDLEFMLQEFTTIWNPNAASLYTIHHFLESVVILKNWFSVTFDLFPSSMPKPTYNSFVSCPYPRTDKGGCKSCHDGLQGCMYFFGYIFFGTVVLFSHVCVFFRRKKCAVCFEHALKMRDKEAIFIVCGTAIKCRGILGKFG